MRKTETSLPRKNTSEIFVWSALAVILLVVTVARLNLLSIPFERDEGSYLYTGQLILDGKTPYVDFYEMKPPGIFYCYALVALVFGASVEGLHLAAMLANLGTILLLFFLARRLFDGASAVAAAAAYAVLALGVSVSGFTGQSEHFVALFAAAGLLVLLRSLESGRRVGLFLGGVLMSAAFLVKTSGMFFLLLGGLIAIAWNLARKPMNWKGAFLDGLTYSAGAFAITAAMVGLIALQGAYDEMRYWVTEFPKQYLRLVSPTDGWNFFARTLQRIASENIALWILAGPGLVLIWFSGRSLFVRIALTLIALLSIGTILPGLRFYGHYWIQLLPSVSLCVACTVYVSATRFRSWKPAAPVVYTFFAVVWLATVSTHRHYYFRPDYHHILRMAYGANPFPEARVIGDWLRKEAEPEDRLCVVGAEPELYIYSGLRSASRHFYFQFLLRNTPKEKDWQREFMREIAETKPRFIVFCDNPISIRVFPGASRSVLYWLKDHLKANYRLFGVAQTVSPAETRFYREESLQLYRPQRTMELRVFERINGGRETGTSSPTISDRSTPSRD